MSLPARSRLRCRAAALLLCWSIGASAADPASPANPGYYRWPAVHAQTVVFSSEGDLWRVHIDGGEARRLTTHLAEESMPAISADGRWLGFVASYDSTAEVYVMPLSGGTPKRLSFDGAPRVLVQGFSADGDLLYSTDAVSGPSWTRQLRRVDPRSGITHALPVHDASDGMLDSATGKLWFTRFGLQVTTDNARAYRGGAMAQLWQADLSDAQGEATRLLPRWAGNLRRPLLSGERLYLISDVSGSDNLWSFNLQGADAVQLTSHKEFEVRSASVHGQTMVYALGADLRVLDLGDGSDRLLQISLAGDREASRERVVRKPLNYLSGASIASDGEQVALNLRGQVHLASTGNRRLVRIAGETGARLRSPVLGSDGKTVYAIRDLGQGSQIVAYPADGSSGGKVLSGDATVHRWRLFLSPDGRWLASDDKQGRLQLLDLQQGTERLLDRAVYGSDQAYRDVVWSADSRWLVVSRPDSTVQREQLLLLPRDGGKPQVLTSDRYPSFAPTFSRDGRWLYFLSQRNLQVSPGSPWGDRNTGPFFDRRSRIYALALQQQTSRFPFLPPDELSAADATAAADTTAIPALQASGLAQRLYEVPLAAGNYFALAADSERLYLLDRDAGTEAKPVLKTLPIGHTAVKTTVLAGDVAGFQLSANGKKLFVQRVGGDGSPSELWLLPAGSKLPDDLDKVKIKLADGLLRVAPLDEWQQMFDDAWRMHAHFSFDQPMRGLDWPALYARYAPWVKRLGERSELDDLLGQMIAELGLLHSQVRQSELRLDLENAADAFLGAAFEPHPQGLRISTLWATEAELPGERGPLQAASVDIAAGDVLLAVNGQAVREQSQLSAALLNQAGQQVLIEVRRAEQASRRFVVTPVSAEREATLRYSDWVQRTRASVQTAADGQIGYLHLRAMGAADMAGFVREFYANFDRPGLIIDVRRNRGGNIDSWVIEKLLRRTWAYWHPPQRHPYWNMPQTFRGHLVVLADALTYSDGETFAAGVQALGLAPVIGTRTAGAGIWLSDRNRLVDNGVARIAEFGQFDAEGLWLIEGSGVSPDIEVENLPMASARGEDAQLAAAIRHLQHRLLEAPVLQPTTQPIPGQSGRGSTRATPLPR